MHDRPFWIDRLENALLKKNVVWLSGVRRVGKTTLCRSLGDVEYFDCELPRTRRVLEDPEGFLSEMSGKRLILDEIHRLAAPSELLKIAADHFSEVKIVATGSSTIGASRKFRDTLAGRKAEVWLTPMIAEDLKSFGVVSLDRRMLRGGLPGFFLAAGSPGADFQEWFDAYWAKDIAELFRLERRQSFLRFAELLLDASGGIFDATRFAGRCEVSRPTIMNYLSILESTHVAHVIRPFSSRASAEITAAPKVYGFDTGFVAYFRDWDRLRAEDRGILWEHLVLNELHAHLRRREIHYWRDKRGHEVDFVLTRGRSVPTAIECKWKVGEFDPSGLAAFRAVYPSGENLVVASDVSRTARRTIGGISVRMVNVEGFVAALTKLDGISRD